MIKTNKKGFTLIELLVVIAIIGLLSTLAIVALNSARLKARDARRASDIKQLQTALELFYAENGAYPSEAADTVLGVDQVCLDNTSFKSGVLLDVCDGTIFMGLVPADPGSTSYTFEDNSADTTDYSILFSLEGAVQGLSTAAASCTATSAGITCT